MSDKELAEVRKLEADTAHVYADTGVILPNEERKRLADDPESMYHGLDPDLEIGTPDDGDDLGEETGIGSRFQATEEGDDDTTADRITGLFDRVRNARGRDAA